MKDDRDKAQIFIDRGIIICTILLMLCFLSAILLAILAGIAMHSYFLISYSVVITILTGYSAWTSKDNLKW